MREILISIQPQWVAKILNGDKTVEIRKTAPKCDLPAKVYIYCTKSKNNYLYKCYSKLSETTNYEIYSRNMGIETYSNGKVVAEFTLKYVDEFYVFENGNVQNWNAHSLDKSLLTYEQLSEYIGKNKKGYAWDISDLKIYDEPKELSEFGIKRAPQSWQYVKGVGL